MFVTITLRAEVTFHDDGVWKRCVQNIDAWRDTFYDLRTIEEVANHIAYNYLVNHRTLSQLDGWADLPDSAVTVREV